MSLFLRRSLSTTRTRRFPHPGSRIDNGSGRDDPPTDISPPAVIEPQPGENDANLPATIPHPQKPRLSTKPPFNTHQFITRLCERGGFPEGMSKSVMLIVQDVLRSRSNSANETTINRGDLENQAYLFRAALSELRTETQTRGRADTAAIRATLLALRREVDALGQKLKEDSDTLKHEIQMEMNNRKNESRVATKVADVAMEELSHKSTITLGELRTEIEAAKWNNTRRGVGVIGFFVIFIIASVELMPAKPKKPSSAPPPIPVLTGQPGSQLDIREFEREG